MRGKVHGRYRDHPEDNDDEDDDDDDDDNENNDDDDLNDEYGLESGGGDRYRLQQRPSGGGRWGSGEDADGVLGDEEQQVDEDDGRDDAVRLCVDERVEPVRQVESESQHTIHRSGDLESTVGLTEPIIAVHETPAL